MSYHWYPDLLAGEKFGRLTVVGRVPDVKSHKAYECLCECGNRPVIRGNSLRAGSTKSCGCWCTDATAARATSHGHCGTVTYARWQAIKSRCGPSAKGKCRQNYFLKGVRVCDRWQNSFENFLDDMGECPEGYEIDRIDNSKGYEPGNCRFVTPAVNRQNQTSIRNITYEGRTQNMKTWARELGLQYATLMYRINTGWPLSEAFHTPGRQSKV